MIYTIVKDEQSEGNGARSTNQKVNAANRVESSVPMSDNNAPEADAPDAAAPGDAKKERVITARSLKILECVLLARKHAHLAVKYKKMTESELPDHLKEQAEKNLEKQKAIAKPLATHAGSVVTKYAAAAAARAHD